MLLSRLWPASLICVGLYSTMSGVTQLAAEQMGAIPEQVLPQTPQLLASMEVSQPSVRLSSLQSRWVASQDPSQDPSTQDGSLIPLLLQGRSQPPQWVRLPVTSTSQPSRCLSWLQSSRPVAHSPSQTRPVHAGVGMPSALHSMSHPPQCSGSLEMLISQPSSRRFSLQSTRSGWHSPWHSPSSQVRVAATIPFGLHASPQAPQLESEVSVF